jgi:hypothetical protein
VRQAVEAERRGENPSTSVERRAREMQEETLREYGDICANVRAAKELATAQEREARLLTL